MVNSCPAATVMNYLYQNDFGTKLWSYSQWLGTLVTLLLHLARTKKKHVQLSIGIGKHISKRISDNNLTKIPPRPTIQFGGSSSPAAHLTFPGLDNAITERLSASDGDLPSRCNPPIANNRPTISAPLCSFPSSPVERNRALD